MLPSEFQDILECRVRPCVKINEEIYLQPNRKKCAMLPFESLKKVLGEEKWKK